MSFAVEFSAVSRIYGSVKAVDQVSLRIEPGEFFSMLGPSGSGKTSCLRLMAGFEQPDLGAVYLGGIDASGLPPYQRDVNTVFQDYALFPHLNVWENIAYGLKVKGVGRGDRMARAEEALELVALGGLGQRKPSQLSGGQRQRVALARALIFSPRLVLMDEPLGALDKKLREQMQLEITRLHKQLGFTVIYVTHDQTEALTMSDRIAVFNNGIVQQCDVPEALYERPGNGFVADFIGENNFLPGKVEGVDGDTVRVRISSGDVVTTRRADATETGAACNVSVRPEKLFILPNEHPFDTQLTATFTTQLYVGDFIRYFFALPDGTEIVVKTLNDVSAPKLTERQSVRLAALSKDCAAFLPHKSAH